MSLDDLLFSANDWHSVAESQKAALRNEVAGYEGNRLLNTSVDDLVDYFVNKYEVEVPLLDRDSIVVGQREAKIDVGHRFDYGGPGRGPRQVPGTAVDITVPFSGEADAFKVRPTTYNLNPPRARTHAGKLEITISGTDLTPDGVRSSIDGILSDIEGWLTRLRGDAQSLNLALPEIARSAITVRREKLLNNQNLVASLGFKLKEHPSSPQTYTASNIKRKLRPSPPTASSTPYKPEPALSDVDYEHILDVIQNMAQVMERSPAAFTTMNEEAIRTHFLVQLNGHYDGEATGETFNYEGKTDILIRSEGKNIFIAECKFWGGPKKMVDTLDQLLGYSCWRDTKVAILVFNRNKSLTKVLESIREATRAHPNCKRELKQPSDTSFRYIFSNRDDENREIMLTIVAFDVPS